jgi:hypothetical protein
MDEFCSHLAWKTKCKVREVQCRTRDGGSDTVVTFPPWFSPGSFRPPGFLSKLAPQVIFSSFPHSPSKWILDFRRRHSHSLPLPLLWDSLLPCGCIQDSSVTARDLFLVYLFLGRTETTTGAHGDFPDCNMIILVVGIWGGSELWGRKLRKGFQQCSDSERCSSYLLESDGRYSR